MTLTMRASQTLQKKELFHQSNSISDVKLIFLGKSDWLNAD